MDFILYLRVLWARRVLMGLGIVVAALAAVFSAYRVSGTSMAARAQVKYDSLARVYIGIGGLTVLPVAPTPTTIPLPGFSTSAPRGGYSPPQLADLYSYLLSSDGVTKQLQATYGPFKQGESVSAGRLVSKGIAPDKSIVPVLEVHGQAKTPQAARAVAQAAAVTLSNYVSGVETAAQVAPADRVNLTVTEAAKAPKRVGSGPVPLMALVFLGVLGGFAALAFTSQALLDYRAREAGRALDPPRAVPAQPAAPVRPTREAAARSPMARAAGPSPAAAPLRAPSQGQAPSNGSADHGAPGATPHPKAPWTGRR